MFDIDYQKFQHANQALSQTSIVGLVLVTLSLFC